MSNKQSYESFPNASIIDNTYINNDLSYIKTLESLYINHSKNTINLYKRLNNIYGKNKSKSLESYLYNKSLDINNKCKSYIENSNESYNRLLEMSREGVVGSIFLGILLAPYIIGPIVMFILNIVDKINITKVNNIVKTLYKDPNFKNDLVSLENDVKNIITTFYNIDIENIKKEFKNKFKKYEIYNSFDIRTYKEDLNSTKGEVKNSMIKKFITKLFKDGDFSNNTFKIEGFSISYDFDKYFSESYKGDEEYPTDSDEYTDELPKAYDYFEKDIKNNFDIIKKIINKNIKNSNIIVDFKLKEGKDLWNSRDFKLIYDMYISFKLSKDYSKLIKYVEKLYKSKK